MTDQIPTLFPLHEIFITSELGRRPCRLPNYRSENQRLVELARALANAPESILQRVTEVAMELCQAESAGLSLLERYGGCPVFRWRALTGAFAPHLGGMTQRDFSPCGVVVDSGQVQLVSSPERYYPYLKTEPPIVECLLLPFMVAGEVRGTLWIMAHDEQRKFDAEDVRTLRNLAEFTAAAYQTQEALIAVSRKQNELEQSNHELEQFSAFVSHDLREPLRTVKTYIQLLAQEYQGRLDHKADEFIAFAVAGIKRMEKRIKALLALVRIGKADGELRLTNLETVLDEVLTDLQTQFAEVGATLQRNPLPTVRARRAITFSTPELTHQCREISAPGSLPQHTVECKSRQ